MRIRLLIYIGGIVIVGLLVYTLLPSGPTEAPERVVKQLPPLPEPPREQTQEHPADNDVQIAEVDVAGAADPVPAVDPETNQVPTESATASVAEITELYNTRPPWDPEVEKTPQQRAVVDTFLSSMDDYDFVPYVIDNRQVGYTIWNGNEDVLTSMGLQRGDTLLTVNSIVMISPEALNTMKDVLSRATLIQINALRNSKQIVLNYEVNPAS